MNNGDLKTYLRWFKKRDRIRRKRRKRGEVSER